MLEQARTKTEGTRWIPKPFRRFFRKQGAYNRVLLDGVAVLAKGSAEVVNRLEQLTACVEVQHAWLRELHQRSEGDRAWMRAAGNGIDRARREGQEQLDFTEGQAAARFLELRNELDQVALALQKSREGIKTLRGEMRRDAATELAAQKLLKDFQILRSDAERSGGNTRWRIRQYGAGGQTGGRRRPGNGCEHYGAIKPRGNREARSRSGRNAGS